MARGTSRGASYSRAELADPRLPEPILKRVRRAEIGPMPRAQKGEESSPGNSSKQHSPSEAKSPDVSDPLLRQPARTTESHSSQPERETDGTAPSTGTAGRKAPAKRARTRTTDDDFGDEF